MQHNKDFIKLNLAIAIASLILGIGFWSLKNLTSPTNTSNGGSASETANSDVRISIGDKILLKREFPYDNPSFQSAKEKGVKAMADKKYSEAVKYFEEALKIQRNAPETRIYLNNAKIGAEEAYTIAVAVPAIPQNNFSRGGANRHPANALEMLRGFAQAQEEINLPDKRINGKRIKLLIVDDNDNRDNAATVARQLISDKNIIGVMGHRLTPVSKIAAPLYAKEKLVFIATTGISSDLNRSDYALNPDNRKRYVFRTDTDSEIAEKKLADYLERRNIKKVAIFYDSSKEITYSQDLRRDFMKFFENKSQGREVIDSIDISAFDEKFFDKQQVDKVINKGAEAILILPNFNSREVALNIISAMPPKPAKPVQLIGDVSNLYRSSTLAQGEKAEGMVLAVATQLTEQDKFYQDALSLWGGKIDLAWQTATSYDAAQIFIEALRGIQAQNRNVDREAIQEQICRKDFKATAASGEPLQFDCDISSTPKDRVKLVQVTAKDPSNKNEYHFKLARE
ncbi:extracellular ligand-binding receptor [Calothrix sp. NIES-4071]|nr:extracellular ligand-binding receptor [Calothrix sp. NIES-4071]BAZ61128.1 extracellular ligand-binding receptor [Calothrix sp. NIES-4105]